LPVNRFNDDLDHPIGDAYHVDDTKGVQAEQH
jgi:hypothetical protein